MCTKTSTKSVHKKGSQKVSTKWQNHYSSLHIVYWAVHTTYCLCCIVYGEYCTMYIIIIQFILHSVEYSTVTTNYYRGTGSLTHFQLNVASQSKVIISIFSQTVNGQCGLGRNGGGTVGQLRGWCQHRGWREPYNSIKDLGMTRSEKGS